MLTHISFSHLVFVFRYEADFHYYPTDRDRTCTKQGFLTPTNLLCQQNVRQIRFHPIQYIFKGCFVNAACLPIAKGRIGTSLAN